MTAEQADGLRKLAALRRRSQAALLRDALDELIGSDERRRRVDAARLTIGRFASSDGPDLPVNTATDHDAELEDAFLT